MSIGKESFSRFCFLTSVMFTFLMFSIAREKDAYRLVGLILAWSVVHGGPGGKFLCPTLYDSVVYGPDVTNPSLDDVPTLQLTFLWGGGGGTETPPSYPLWKVVMLCSFCPRHH